MQRHAFAFAGEPLHAIMLRDRTAIAVSQFGAAWTMPVSVCDAPRGFGEETRLSGLPHHTLAFALAPAEVEQIEGTCRGRRGGTLDDVTLHNLNGPQCFVARGPVRFAHLYFKPDLFAAAAADVWHGRADQCRLRDDRVFVLDRPLRSQIDQYVARTLNAEQPPGALEMDARAALILVHLARFHSSLSQPAALAQRGGLAPRVFARVREAMHGDLSRDLRLAELASLANLSVFHFVRAFGQSAGMPPHRYLLGLRIARAKELLAGSDLTIGDVAAAVGYSDPAHFAKLFRREVGAAPMRYRAEQRS